MLEVFTNTICTVGVPYTAVCERWSSESHADASVTDINGVNTEQISLVQRCSRSLMFPKAGYLAEQGRISAKKGAEEFLQRKFCFRCVAEGLRQKLAYYFNHSCAYKLNNT